MRILTMGDTGDGTSFSEEELICAIRCAAASGHIIGVSMATLARAFWLPDDEEFRFLHLQIAHRLAERLDMSLEYDATSLLLSFETKLTAA